MSGITRAALAAAATATLASCGGGAATATHTPAPATATSAPAVATPVTVPPHDIAVALRSVLTKASAELNGTSSDLAAAATLDQAAETMGNHAFNFDNMHQTLAQLPAFPVPQTLADVTRLSNDVETLSTTLTTMINAEVAQYGQYKAQINAEIPVLRNEIAAVTNDLKPY